MLKILTKRGKKATHSLVQNSVIQELWSCNEDLEGLILLVFTYFFVKKKKYFDHFQTQQYFNFQQ